MLFALGAPHAVARADDKTTCIAAYEEAQGLRRGGDHLTALARARECSSVCPERLAADCTTWAEELQASIPTIELAAVDGSNRAIDGVRVSIDGSEPAPMETGAFAVNPGKHVLSFIAPDGRVTERTLVVAPRERGRKIVAIFAADTTQVAPTQEPAERRGGVAPPPDPGANEESAGGVPPVAWALGGIGLAALLTAGGLAIAGHLERRDLEDSPCAIDRSCDTTQVRRYWTAGAVLAAVGGSLVVTGIVVGVVMSDDNGAAHIRVRTSAGVDVAVVEIVASF